MKRITKFKSPIGLIMCEYGCILYKTWCERERDRINESFPGDAYLVREKGMVAVARRSLVTNKEGE